MLSSTLSIQLDDNAIAYIPAGHFGPREGSVNVLLAGDVKHTPDSMQLIPEVVLVDPEQEITVSVICTNPLFLLSKGTPFAQMYVLNGQDFMDMDNYNIYLTQVLGKDKPKIKCHMNLKKQISISFRYAGHGSGCHPHFLL